MRRLVSEVKLTKNELRAQQNLQGQLNRYLPTLQLKKSLLQSEVQEARLEIVDLQNSYDSFKKKIKESSALLSCEVELANLLNSIKTKEIKKRFENIAGVEVAYCEGVVFEEISYSLLETPPWVDGMILSLRDVKEASIKVLVAKEKKRALEKELREVSIRVNLFEKILIPRTQRNIRKVKVFLNDQELAAVSQAKVAKKKIEKNKQQNNEVKVR